MGSKRLQITVPQAVAAKWEVQAEIMGVSLSNWVAMMVGRDDTASHAYTELLRRTDVISKYLGELMKATASRSDQHSKYLLNIAQGVAVLVQREGESE